MENRRLFLTPPGRYKRQLKQKTGDRILERNGKRALCIGYHAPLCGDLLRSSSLATGKRFAGISALSICSFDAHLQHTDTLHTTIFRRKFIGGVPVLEVLDWKMWHSGRVSAASKRHCAFAWVILGCARA